MTPPALADRIPAAMRQHIRWTDRGKWVSKVKYPTRADAARAAAEMYERTGHHVEPYMCGFCGSWHVGKPRHAAIRLDRDALVAEMGARVYMNLKHENSYGRKHRLKTIRSRTHAAEKRRAALAA